MTKVLRPRALDKDSFAPFGDVIETEGARSFLINNGTTERFHDLCRIDVAAEGGHALLSVFRGQPFQLPMTLRLMERHPLGSQAFFPLSDRPFLIVVGRPGAPLDPENLEAFISKTGQGINYARDVWHHPLIALEAQSDFLIVDRGGAGENLEEVEIEGLQIRLEL